MKDESNVSPSKKAPRDLSCALWAGHRRPREDQQSASMCLLSGPVPDLPPPSLLPTPFPNTPDSTSWVSSLNEDDNVNTTVEEFTFKACKKYDKANLVMLVPVK